MKRGVVAAGLWFGLAGCFGHVSDDVQKKYTQRVRQLGLIPVYPAREEVQVGDMFITSEQPRRDEHAVRAYLGTLDGLRAMAQGVLDDRVVFTPTTAAGQNAGTSAFGNPDGSVDLADGRLITRRQARSADKDSLPLAAFPEITADAGGSLNAGLLAPLQALGLFAGARTTVTLGFNDVRTYFAPPVDAFLAAKREICLRPAAQRANDLNLIGLEAQAEDSRTGIGASRERVERYRIVTRVYLTRSINYTYRNGRILALARQNLTAGKPTSQTAPAGMTIVNVGSTGTDKATISQDQVNQIIAALKAQNTGTGDGVEFGGFSALGLTLVRTFKHPVVIAYEGFDLPARPGQERDQLDCTNLGAVPLKAPAVGTSTHPTVVGPSTSVRG